MYRYVHIQNTHSDLCDHVAMVILVHIRQVVHKHSQVE